MPERQECDVCGGEKPAPMVERTTVKPIEPVEADICETCQLVQNHGFPDDACMQCGAALPDGGHYIEVEYPLGAADLPARLAGSLCGECAGWIGCDLQYEGLRADDDASEEFVAIQDREDDYRAGAESTESEA